MSFLNVILLGGTLAFSVPLIIHLLNRARHKVVRWGASHLLVSALKVNQRRLKWEHWILLLLRCAIPILLALALARPVLSGWHGLTGSVPASMVVLLDNSYSMQAGTTTRTGFQTAVEETGRLLRDLRSGSDASVLLCGGGVNPVTERPTVDLSGLADRLENLKAESGAMKPLEALNAAASLLPRMANARRSIVVVSDFQKADWGEANVAAFERLSQQLTSESGRAGVTFFRVGQAAPNNVCVESLEFSRAALGVGQPLTVRANLRNYGELEQRDLRVYFRIDGNQNAAAQVNIAPESSAQAEFVCRFTTPGSHVIDVEADAADLHADNVYSAAIEVLESLPVLLVDGDPKKNPLASETGYLRAALTPFTAAAEDVADLIKTEIVSASDFHEGNLAGKRAVVLANVPELRADQVKALDEFVRAGGGVLVFLGDKVKSEWYNAELFAEGAGLLPAKLGPTVGHLEDPSRQTVIMGQQFEHPALTFFNDPKNGDLSKAKIRLWYRLDASAGIAAKLGNGDPFLVSKRVGDGTVLLCSTACDADWSNLPLRPVFVPLMQQLVANVAANALPPRNVSVGQPLIALVEGDRVGQTYRVTAPDARVHDVVATGKGVQAIVEFDDTHDPGVYVMNDPTGKAIQFVVNVDRTESKLDLVSDSDLQKIAVKLDAPIVRTGEEFAKLEHNRQFGREIWKGLLIGMLGMLFVEQYLARRFAR